MFHLPLKRCAVIGFIVGWLAGVVWWCGLMLYFGSSISTMHNAGVVTETRISVMSRVLFAPIVAIPWGMCAGFVGFVSSLRKGCLVPILSIVGASIGFSLAFLDKVDGMSVFVMPMSTFVGAFLGLLIGFLLSARKEEKIH